MATVGDVRTEARILRLDLEVALEKSDLVERISPGTTLLGKLHYFQSTMKYLLLVLDKR